MDVCTDIGFLLINEDQENYYREIFMNAEIGRSIIVARFVEVNHVTDSLVSTSHTTFTFPLSPDRGIYAPLEDVRQELDISTHDFVKLSLRARNAARKLVINNVLPEMVE